MTDAPRIRVEATPNPDAMKFTAPRELWQGRPLTVSDSLQAFAFPLAGRLLRIEGVRGLFFLRDFVTVTRTAGADWQPITGQVEQVLVEHLTTEG